MATLAVVALAWLHGREPQADRIEPPPAAAATAAASARASRTEAVASVPVQSRQAAALPLPPQDTPLALIHDDLAARAAAGDARAACRLAAEHERCETIGQQHRALLAHQRWMHQSARASRDGAAVTASTSGQDPQQILQHVAEQIADHARVLQRCEGVTPVSPAQRAAYWRQAALADHVPSMRHYASGNAFRMHELMDMLPALRTYRGEAEAIARRAARQGDVATMHALAMAYANADDGSIRSFLAQAVTPDLVQALAWFTVLDAHPEIVALPAQDRLAQSIDRHLAELRAAATAEESTAAAREVEALPAAARGAPVPDRAGRHRFFGGVQDLHVAACDDAPRQRAG
ncbi:hypothetical protein LDO31_16410 [Luteimonas sp. XNQY3]|nr:hypothetical protein [Luteimonas sp. XNQY3]MCD9007784.1 hypothetical protein [Luteimonas sp. XNQY3]